MYRAETSSLIGMQQFVYEDWSLVNWKSSHQLEASSFFFGADRDFVATTKLFFLSLFTACPRLGRLNTERVVGEVVLPLSHTLL